MAALVDLTAEQQMQAAHAAQELLRHALDKNLPAQLTRVAIEAVGWSAPILPRDAVGLLRRCLTPELVNEQGHDILPSMAEYLPELAEASGEFALELVEVLSKAQARADEFVTVGKIVAISIRKPDLLAMAEYRLEQHFSTLLRTHPVVAARILILVVETHITKQSYASPGQSSSFVFLGREARFSPDASYIWGAERESVGHETWHKLATKFREAICSIASDSASIIPVLEAFRDHAAHAILWNQLLIAGSKAAATLGCRLVDLVCAAPILTSPETKHAASSLLTAVYPHLENSERARIEHAILALPEAEPDDVPETNTRDCLLGCIPPEQIVTDDARTRILELKAAGGPPAMDPPEEFEPARFMSRDEVLRMEGVSLDLPQNATFRRVLGEVQAYHGDPNKIPTLSEVQELGLRLHEFDSLIASASSSGVDPRLSRNAVFFIYGCCKMMSRCKELQRGTIEYDYIRNRLLEAAVHAAPQFREDNDAHWDEDSSSWGSPLPRIDAAQGLINLASSPNTVDDEILGMIERLATDSVAAVRYQIGAHLLALWSTDRELFWRLTEDFSAREMKVGVLRPFVTSVLLALPRSVGDRTNALLSALYSRAMNHPKGAPVREACVVFFVQRAIWEQDGVCQAFVETVADNPLAKEPELTRVVALCRKLLTHEDPQSSNEENERVRRWAFGFLQRAFASTERTLGPWLERSRNEKLSDDDVELIRTLVRHEDQIAHEVFFASGAFEEKRQSTDQSDSQNEMTAEQLCRFAREAEELLEVVCASKFSNVAYTVLQTLQHLRRADPRRMFLLAGKLVRAATADSFQFESLAADKVVEIVEQYLAEDRGLFRGDAEMLQTLMDMLDLFVSAGWPKAIALTYRLDEFFR